MLLALLSKNIYNPDISYPPPLFQFIIISHMEIWNTHITSLPTSILHCSLLSTWQLNESCHLSPHALQWLFNPGRTYIACTLLNASNLHLLLPGLLSYTHSFSFWSLNTTGICLFQGFPQRVPFFLDVVPSDTCPCPTSNGTPGEPLSHFFISEPEINIYGLLLFHVLTTYKVRRGSAEEIPLVQGKELWLCFAGAAVKRYSMPKVRETQVRR